MHSTVSLKAGKSTKDDDWIQNRLDNCNISGQFYLNSCGTQFGEMIFDPQGPTCNRSGSDGWHGKARAVSSC